MGLVLAGLIFIFFDLNQGPVDILADFAGYLFILRGLSDLSRLAPAFGGVKVYALALFCYSLVLFFLALAGVTDLGAAGFLFNLAALAGELLLLQGLAKGVGELEVRAGRPIGADILKKIWKVLAVVSAASYFMAYFNFLGALGVIAGVLLYLAYIVAFFRAKNLYELR